MADNEKTVKQVNLGAEDMAENKQAADLEKKEAARVKEEQAEAKKQADAEQKIRDKRDDLMASIHDSDDGFVEREGVDQEAFDAAMKDGYIYTEVEQSGPGGLKVKEVIRLSAKGNDHLTS